MDIWLPPSEGKNAPSDGPNLNLDSLSFPILNSTRAGIINTCAQITETHTAQRVFNIGAKHEAELAANRALMSQPCAPASTVFTGVLYEALREHNPTIWGGPEARHILIFSGMFGVLRADDMIPLHRLAMGATLPTLGKVSALWRRVLNEELKDHYAEHTILDCRSSDYKNACSAQWAHLWDVRVEREKNGKRSVVSHNAKKWRGILAAALAPASSTITSEIELKEALHDIIPRICTCDARGVTSRVKAIEVSPPRSTRLRGSTRTLTLITAEE